MNSIDKNWQRWFMSSIYDHFKKGVLDLQSKPIVKINFDSEDQQTTTGKGQADSFEFKHLGPDFNFITQNEVDVTVSINVMAVTYMDINDPFRHMNNVGLAQSLFTPCLRIYKYGPYQGIDDKSFLTYLTTEPNIVKTTNFGTFDPVTRILRTTVEATYKGILQGAS